LIADLSVLVVDDEPDVADRLAEGLRLFGHSVAVAYSVAEALTRLEGDTGIGVVITDIRMPGRDGISLAAELLKRDPLDKVGLIVITGHATLDDAAAAIRAGVSDFLRKPFRLYEAGRAVAQALAAAARHRAEAALARERAHRVHELEATCGDLLRRIAAAEVDPRGKDAGLGAVRDSIARELHAISHALRTPLNSIAGTVDALALSQQQQPVDALDSLQASIRCAVEAVSLVEELYRAPTDTAASCRVRMSVGGTLHAAIRAATPAAQARGIDLVAASPALPDAKLPITFPRIINHVLASTIAWCPTGGLIELSARQLSVDATDWLVLDLRSAKAPPLATPAEGLALPTRGSEHSRTQEDLGFLLARRLAEMAGGQVSSSIDDRRRLTSRIALPTTS
jgi:FixJ family two-component response regulator